MVDKNLVSVRCNNPQKISILKTHQQKFCHFLSRCFQVYTCVYENQKERVGIIHPSRSVHYGRPFVSKLVMTTLCKKWVTLREELLASRDNCDTLRDYYDTSRDNCDTSRDNCATSRDDLYTSSDVIQHRATTSHNDIALLGRAAVTRDGCH